MDEYIEQVRLRLQALKVEEEYLLGLNWIGKCEGYPVPSLNWCKGKYLELHFKLSGSVKVVYVGSDPLRVRVALEGVERQKRIKVLSKQIDSCTAFLGLVEGRALLIGLECKSYLNELG